MNRDILLLLLIKLLTKLIFKYLTNLLIYLGEKGWKKKRETGNA